MKNPTPMYGIVVAHSMTPLSSTLSNASLIRLLLQEPFPCHVYLIVKHFLLLFLLHHKLPSPKRPRSYPGHFTSFSGQCSSQNHLPVLWFDFKINPRMDFTSFTISPGHLPPFLKLLRLILVSFRRKSAPW